jgi:mxaD protein
MIMKRLLAALALMTASASSVFAADAPTLTVSKSVEINAPASVVWSLVKDFDGLNKWHPAVAKDVIVEGQNNTVGAIRVLTLGDGGTIKEKLLAYDDKGQSFKYSILEGVLPVSSYESTLLVEGTADAAKVTWSAASSARTPARRSKGCRRCAKTTMEGAYRVAWTP